MRVNFLRSNSSLHERDIHIENYEPLLFDEDEKYLLTLFRKWLEHEPTLSFQTSGSTGQPKRIELSYKRLQYSAQQTLEKLSIDTKNAPFLLCISPHFIGGAMVGIRAILADCELDVVPPNELTFYLSKSYQLTSLVPLQVEQLIEQPEKFCLLSTALIGGAPLSPLLENQVLKQLTSDQSWYATYGMTETASHVALRKLGQKCFEAIGDVKFSLDDRGCLGITGTITEHKTLWTNDLVELKSDDTFVWKGRYDFIINSGGFKVSPEKVESLLQGLHTDAALVVTWVTDSKLGQKVVCLSTKAIDKNTVKHSEMHPYEVPKQFFKIEKLPKTENGKPDRMSAQKIAEKLTQEQSN